MTRARPMAIAPVEPHKTRPTTHGIRTAAVATRFQVIEMESPDEWLVPSHHIKGNKSRGRSQKRKIPVPEIGFQEAEESWLNVWVVSAATTVGHDESCPYNY